MIVLFESRLKIVLILFIILLIIISFRMIYVSIKMSDSSTPFQNTISSIQRGEILDRDGNLLAGNFLVYTVFIDPYVINDINSVAEKLAPHSNYSKENLIRKIVENKNKRYLEIIDKIDRENLQKILSFKINGVYYRTDILREYPLSETISPLLGFVDKYNRGLEGLEFYYDQFLTRGDEYNIRLTIDSYMQYILYNKLKEKAEEENAQWGLAVIADAYTNQLLAVVNWPSFKPDLYMTYPFEKRKNRALLDAFEPGSTFKVFISAALINEKKISFNDYFYCRGQYNVTENIVIKDTAIHGKVNLYDIIRQSCNTGIIEASSILNSKDLFLYLRNFNFGNKTGISYPAEPEGLLKPLNKWTKMTRAIINIGQEISVSSLQLVTAFNSLINGGDLYEPIIVIEKNYKKSKIEKTRSKIIRKVISTDTSSIVKNILIEALKGHDATGKWAYTDKAIVGGKTGTAQVPYYNEKGYDPDQILTSFLGFFEIDSKIYTIYIALLNPKKNRYGGTASAPVFKDVVEILVPYLRIKNLSPNIVKSDDDISKNIEFLYSNALKRIIDNNVVPDFTGLSLKETIFLASKLGIKIKLKGSGFVVYQSINPGSPIKENTIVEIELKYK